MRRIYINAGQYGMFLFRYILIEFERAKCDQPNIYIDKDDDVNKDEYVIFEDTERKIDILSNILVSYIFNIYEPEIIGSLIGNLSDYYDYNERYSIFDKTKNKILLYNDEIKNSKKSAVMKIAELLKTRNIFNIEGFIIFRLKEYIFILKSIVEEALDDYLCEKEHAEFMKMLAYFVDMQETVIDKVNVVVSDESEYLIYDDLGNQFFLKESDTLPNMIAFDREAEDILIGMLISLMPGTILIHDMNGLMSGQLMDIISDIFGSRVAVCDKCPDCNIFQLIETDRKK